MSYLTQRIKELLEKAESDTGIAKSRLLMKAGVMPGQYFNSEAGKRPWSDSVLNDLGDSGILGLTSAQLLALKVLEQYPSEAILEAYKELVAKGLIDPVHLKGGEP